MITAAIGQIETSDVYVPPPRGGHYERTLIALLFSTWGLVFFDRLALSFLAPDLKESLGLSDWHIGLLSGIPALSWALSGVLVGYLSDRADRRKPFVVGAVIAFTILSALSGAVGGFATLLMLRALMGAAEGGVLPLVQPLLVHSAEPKRRGFVMGLVQGTAAGLIGGVLGPIVIVFLADQFGWRAAFAATAVPGVLIAVAILVWIRDLRLRHPATLAMRPELAAHETRLERGAVRIALRNRNIVVCVAIAIVYMTWFACTQAFTPLYLREEKGFSDSQRGLVLAGAGAAWVVWGVVIPAVSDRIGRRRAMAGFTAIAATSPLMVLFIDQPVTLFFCLCLTYTGMGCFTLFTSIIPAETVAPILLATSLGLVQGIGEIVGGCVAPLVAGALSDGIGPSAPLYFSCGAAVVAFGLTFLLRETAPRRISSGALA
ncbi:MAG: MFS transporter [Segniliparus sp.]|uniref:MFS transporter n=1 Tax=Segniliparus sp. TaxID=2804064 RepID=UPI003F3E2E3A